MFSFNLFQLYVVVLFSNNHEFDSDEHFSSPCIIRIYFGYPGNCMSNQVNIDNISVARVYAVCSYTFEPFGQSFRFVLILLINNNKVPNNIIVV